MHISQENHLWNTTMVIIMIVVAILFNMEINGVASFYRNTLSNDEMTAIIGGGISSKQCVGTTERCAQVLPVKCEGCAKFQYGIIVMCDCNRAFDGYCESALYHHKCSGPNFVPKCQHIEGRYCCKRYSYCHPAVVPASSWYIWPFGCYLYIVGDTYYCSTVACMWWVTEDIYSRTICTEG